MICVTTQYFSLNRMLLLVIGLWPYQQSKFDRLRFIFFLSILISAILFQFTTFLNSKCTPDFIVKILSSTLLFTIFVIKYIFFAVNTKFVKDLLTQLQHVYEQLRDEYENAIFEKYSYNAKRCTLALTTFSICSIFALIVVQFWSNIIDIILSRNVSRSHRLPILTEYFVDQEKYFFLILLHLNAAFCTGMAVVVATGTMLIAYLVHTCGLFEISSYRIKHVMGESMVQYYSPKNDILILKEIRYAVDLHRQAMKLCKVVTSRFEKMMSCLIIAGVLTLSLNLFQIFRVASVANNVGEIFFPSLLAFAIILYMFCANYLGQNITDHNNLVAVTVYNVQWYTAPLYVQKLVLFLLLRNANDFTINIGGLFIASLASFATLVKTSVSYFTVLYSTQ